VGSPYREQPPEKPKPKLTSLEALNRAFFVLIFVGITTAARLGGASEYTVPVAFAAAVPWLIWEVVRVVRN
jgi:hypothetical protein